MEFDYNNILIFGYGKSGKAVEDVLKDIKVKYKIYDNKIKLQGGNFLYRLSTKVLKQFDLIVISPAVSINNKYVKLAERLGIKVIGELEFGFWFTSAEVVAVTGTNGKTTTTHLINLALQKAGYKTDEYGNIGNPLSTAYKKDLDYIVCEVSSFQLESTDKFAPYVTVFLNLAEDHIDRHGSFENYVNIKKSIFKNSDVNDFVVLNGGDEICNGFKDDLIGKVVLFNSEAGFELKGNKLTYSGEEVLELNDALLNYTYGDNILATAGALDSLDVDLNVLNEIDVKERIPHRLETFLEKDGVTYIDDSKATNPHSTLKALSQIEGNVILLLGGLDKNFNFDLLIEKLPRSVEKIITFGKAGKKVLKSCKKCGKQAIYQKTLENATKYVVSVTKTEDVVLLSPACASFDEFEGYDKRGEFFKDLVKKLVNGDEKK